jgi:predicted RNA-binding Zn-ribbon protein involved in translation (DUF1610 family)
MAIKSRRGENMNNPKQKRECPKCGQLYEGRGALSRVDDKTTVCPECGRKEAVEAYNKAHGKEE